MSILDTIKKAVTELSQEAQEQRLYKEARLADGRVVATEADEFALGADVVLLGEEGATEKLEAGTYEFADGGNLIVNDDSKVAELSEDDEKTEADEHYKKDEDEDEMSAKLRADLTDRFDVTEDVVNEIIKIVKDAMGGGDDKKEEAKKHDDEDKEKMSASDSQLQEFADIMADAVAKIESRLTALEAEPAADPEALTPDAFSDMVMQKMNVTTTAPSTASMTALEFAKSKIYQS